MSWQFLLFNTELELFSCGNILTIGVPWPSNAVWILPESLCIVELSNQSNKLKDSNVIAENVSDGKIERLKILVGARYVNHSINT